MNAKEYNMYGCLHQPPKIRLNMESTSICSKLKSTCYRTSSSRSTLLRRTSIFIRSDSSIEPTLCLLFEASRLSDAIPARTRGEDGERRGVAFDVPGGKTFVPGPEHDVGATFLMGSGHIEVSVSISPEGQEGVVGNLIGTSACCGCNCEVTVASQRDGDMHSAGVGSPNGGR